MTDLLIRGGTLVRPDGLLSADLAIYGGRVVSIGQEGALPEADAVIDAGGLFVLPGLVDPHAHMRDFVRAHVEDWTTGTQAAAAGGVTTILEMPNTVPPTATNEALTEKQRIAAQRAVVDYGLYAGAGADNLDQIPRLAEAGVVGFKTFLHGLPPGRENEYTGLCAEDAGQLWAVMKAVAATGLPLVVHAEDQSVIRQATRALQAQGRRAPQNYGTSRPLLAEVLAVSSAIALAEATAVRLSIAHVSSGSAAEVIRLAKSRGVPVLAETCPHYLFADERAMATLGPYAQVSPPLRSLEEQERLWACVADGTIDFIGSDHAPHEMSRKESGWDDVFASPSGMPTLETMLPLLLTAVHHGRLDLPAVARLTAAAPARVFGLAPRKGGIEVGADADLVIVDMERRGVIDPDAMWSKCRSTARLFAGRETVGAAVMTVVRGAVVMRDGDVIGQPGYGQYIRPAGR